MMSDVPVYAIGDRKWNSELMVDCKRLGYLAEPVLDATYGLGTFWNDYMPENLVANDLNPITPEVLAFDFRELHLHWDRFFGTVVFDPPYKMSGTQPKGPQGAANLNGRYGIDDVYLPTEERLELMRSGLVSCCAVSHKFVLAKCKDQVVSGKVCWQTDMLTRVAASQGFRKRDALHVLSSTRQPPGRSQQHARRDYSTLLVFERQ